MLERLRKLWRGNCESLWISQAKEPQAPGWSLSFIPSICGRYTFLSNCKAAAFQPCVFLSWVSAESCHLVETTYIFPQLLLHELDFPVTLAKGWTSYEPRVSKVNLFSFPSSTEKTTKVVQTDPCMVLVCLGKRVCIDPVTYFVGGGDRSWVQMLAREFTVILPYPMIITSAGRWSLAAAPTAHYSWQWTQDLRIREHMNFLPSPALILLDLAVYFIWLFSFIQKYCFLWHLLLLCFTLLCYVCVDTVDSSFLGLLYNCPKWSLLSLWH